MTIRSGTVCKCEFCGYVGPCYGTPIIPPGKVSAPWCPKCGLNDRLTPQTPETKEEIQMNWTDEKSYNALMERIVNADIKKRNFFQKLIISHDKDIVKDAVASAGFKRLVMGQASIDTIRAWMEDLAEGKR